MLKMLEQAHTAISPFAEGVSEEYIENEVYEYVFSDHQGYHHGVDLDEVRE